MAYRRPILATAWISILFLVFLELQVLMTGIPNKVQIIYQNKEDINKNTKYDRTLETNSKVGFNNHINNSRPLNYNLNTGSDDKIKNNAGGRLSEYELLFKSNLKSDKHEKDINTKNEKPKTNNEYKTKNSKEHFILDSTPAFIQQDKVVSSKSSTENVQRTLNILQALPLLQAIGGMIGGQDSQGTSNKLMNGVLGLLSPASSKSKSSSNGILKNSLQALPLLQKLGGMIGGQDSQGSSSKLMNGVLDLLSPASSKSKSSSNGILKNSLQALPLLQNLGGMIGGQVAQGSSSKLMNGVLDLLSPASSKSKSSSNRILKNALGLFDPNSLQGNIINNYVESKLSQTKFLKGLFGNKNYKSSSVLGSEEAKEKDSKSSVLGNAGELVGNLFGSSYKDYFKKLRQGWDELFFEIQPPSLGVHEKVQPPGSHLEPREEVIETEDTQQQQLLKEEEQELDGCGCTRRLPVKRDLGHIILRREGTIGEILTRTIPRLSTCSNTATLRGPQQKVVSYTYYGDTSNPGINNRYFSEIKNRAEEVAKLYPGWVMRLYHNISVSDTRGHYQLCEVVCQQPHVDLCSISNLPTPWRDITHTLETATLWRFLPLLDPLVDILVSRDLDSYILQREVAAVTAWLASPRLYHAMRDHPLHGTPMLAGLWGAHSSLDRAEVYQSIATLLSQVPNHDWGYDQFLLRKVLWPTAQNNVLVHDSYFCDFPAMLSRYPAAAFPTQREGLNYTGFGKTKLSVTKLLQPCPSSCRPIDHKDWKYC